MTTARIARLDQTKLRESAYLALRHAFTRGEFAPGEVVSLRTLAEQLGISMTPVREAVRRLVAEGALIDTPSRTLQVPAFDARRMEDLKSARLALEPLVLEQAMGRIDADGLEALRHTLDPAQVSAADGPDLGQNYDFHFTLYGFSGSEVLLPMVEALWCQYGAYLHLIIQHEAVRRVPEHLHHHQIIDAIEAADVPAARAALIEDIERSFRVLLPQTDETTP